MVDYLLPRMIPERSMRHQLCRRAHLRSGENEQCHYVLAIDFPVFSFPFIFEIACAIPMFEKEELAVFV